jgi:hypothetical protein
MNAIMKDGTIASALVKKALFNLDTFIFINPSIMYYPESVPVSVELYPAASNPIAQIYFAETPKLFYNTLPAVDKTIVSLFLSSE